MAKKLVIPTFLIAALIALVLYGGSNLVAAQETSGYPLIVTRLAERFSLKQEDVDEVFEQIRSEHQAEMQKRFEERLTQAVTDGKITEAQKQALLERHQEMLAEREARRLQQREEFEAWAQEQGLSLDTLREIFPGPGFHHMGGMKMGYHMGKAE